MVDVDVVNKICSIPLPLIPQSDSCCWGPNANGKYSVKSATWIQNSINNNVNSSKLLKRMWNLSLPHKVEIFSWLLILGKLQTRDHLARYVNNMPTICPLCNSKNESLSPLFVNCDFARHVWNIPTISNSLRINQTLNFNDLLKAPQVCHPETITKHQTFCHINRILPNTTSPNNDRGSILIFNHKTEGHMLINYRVVKVKLDKTSSRGRPPNGAGLRHMATRRPNRQ